MYSAGFVTKDIGPVVKTAALYNDCRKWSPNYTMCSKNETRVTLNILYSCKFIAMKFSMWYPDDLSY